MLGNLLILALGFFGVQFASRHHSSLGLVVPDHLGCKNTRPIVLVYGVHTASCWLIMPRPRLDYLLLFLLLQNRIGAVFVPLCDAF